MSRHPKPTSNLPLLDDLKNLIKRTEKVVRQEKRLDYTKHVGETLDTLIDELSRQGKECSNGGWSKVRKDWRELKNLTDKLLRQQQLLNPASPKEFDTAVRWMAGRGMEEELELLLRVRERPPQFEQPDLFEQPGLFETFTPEALSDLVEAAIEKIRERLSDPYYIMERGEEAYEKNRAEWEAQYGGQFIAIHRGEVVAADEDEGRLAKRLVELQHRDGRFTVYVVKVGAPMVCARGPRVRLRGPAQEGCGKGSEAED